ncbi:MAG TPA: hypothetical protein ENJ79_10385 [Gammaproteobacteria bacterium]|nr:hypothetical protein [Gammaproteobacteria bacterium]
MSTLQLTIPARDHAGPALRIKPREVRQWLEDLPYLDPARAASLASRQLRVMNRQDMPTPARLETLGQFLAAYRRLGDALPPGAGDTDKLGLLLRRLCQDIAFGYKISVSELADDKRPALLGGRQLPRALLGAIHTLGLQLDHYYSHYQRAPRALWSECLTLYRYAREHGHADYQDELAGAGKARLDEAFRRVALLRQSDPYRLPAGMVAALSDYFRLHMAASRICDNEACCHNAFRLAETWKPDGIDSGQAPLYLDVDELVMQLGEDIARLEHHRQAQAIGLPGDLPAHTLLQTLRGLRQHWVQHPERSSAREAVNSPVEMVCGLDAAWCMANGGEAFDPERFLDGTHIDIQATAGTLKNSQCQVPRILACTALNHTAGGVAVHAEDEAQAGPVAGQLVAVRRPGGRWVLAVCRWLSTHQQLRGFESGLQYLARDPAPTVIQPLDEGGPARHQPAFILPPRDNEPVLLVPTGALEAGQLFKLRSDSGVRQARCTRILEQETGYLRITFRPTG